MATLASEETPMNPLKRKVEETLETDGPTEDGATATNEAEDTDVPVKKKKKKVSFDGVTVYYFRRLQGFTSVPSQGGSTLGMSSKHEKLCKLSLLEYAYQQEMRHRTSLKVQLIERRKIQLRERGQEFNEEEIIEEVEKEVNALNIYDYYFLQPIPTKQRRVLLRLAGIKKIDRTEKLELKKIRQSRESCGCDCKGFCDPSTCMCALAGIKCQVDRMSFPCGCTKDHCGNSAGRIEFNPIKVRAHFLETIRRLSGDYQSESECSSVCSSPVRIPQFAGQAGMDSYLSDPGLPFTPQASPSYLYSNSLHEDFSRGFTPGQFHDTFGHHSQSICTYSPHRSLAYNSITPEGGIPLQIESCHTNPSQTIHFNDHDEVSESDILESHYNTNLSLPSMASYDSSDDSMSSGSDTSSNSDNAYQSQSIPYYFESSDTNEFFKSNVVEETLAKSNLVDSDGSGKTYTELTQSATQPSFSFSHFPSISGHLESPALPPMGSIFQGLGTTRPEPTATLTMLTQGSTNTSLYPTYTTSPLANSFEEQKETVQATNSISSSTSLIFDHTRSPSDSEYPIQEKTFAATHLEDQDDSHVISNHNNELEEKEDAILDKENENSGGSRDSELSNTNEAESNENMVDVVEGNHSEASSDSAVFSGTEDPATGSVMDGLADNEGTCHPGSGCSLSDLPQLSLSEDHSKPVAGTECLFLSEKNDDCVGQEMGYIPSLVTPGLLQVGAQE